MVPSGTTQGCICLVVFPSHVKQVFFMQSNQEQGWKVVIQKDAKFQQINEQTLDEPARDGQSIRTLVDALEVEQGQLIGISRKGSWWMLVLLEQHKKIVSQITFLVTTYECIANYMVFFEWLSQLHPLLNLKVVKETYF